LKSQAATDLNNVVCDYPKTNPALHTFEPSVPTAIQSMAPLQHANATFERLLFHGEVRTFFDDSDRVRHPPVDFEETAT
jgi:hypothetical protein